MNLHTENQSAPTIGIWFKEQNHLVGTRAEPACVSPAGLIVRGDLSCILPKQNCPGNWVVSGQLVGRPAFRLLHGITVQA